MISSFLISFHREKGSFREKRLDNKIRKERWPSWLKAPVLKTGGGDEPPVGSNPTLSVFSSVYSILNLGKGIRTNLS